MTVSQLTTVTIELSTSQTPVGSGCTDSFFYVIAAILPDFIAWSAPNKLIVSPTLATSINSY